MWPLLIALFVSGKDAGKNRERAGYALLGLLALNVLGASAVAAGTAAIVARVTPGPITKAVAAGLWRAYWSVYGLSSAANGYNPLPRAMLRSALASLVHQVVPGTITIAEWFGAYDPSGVVRARFEDGEIPPAPDDVYLLETVPRRGVIE